jgi:hypothetical protein
MKPLIFGILLVFSVVNASAKTLKEVEDQFYFAFGVQTAKIFCPAQAKPYALDYLEQIKSGSCGFEPMDSVYRAQREMPLESIPNTVTFWWESKQVSSQKKCLAKNSDLADSIKLTLEKSLGQCQLIGNSSCDALPLEFYFTSDKYCVVIGKTQPASGSHNVEIEKLLAAKNKLSSAMSIYKSVPCESQSAENLVAEAKALINSSKPTETTDSTLNGICTLLGDH